MKNLLKIWNPFLCSLTAAVVLLGGCSFPERPTKETQTYLPAVTVPAAPSALQPAYCFSVRPCRAAPAFSTKSFVYRTGEAEYEKDFYNQLLTTPAENITQTLSNWITAAGWKTCVPGTAPKDFYTVVPVLDEFYGDFRDPTNPNAAVKMQISLTFTDSTCKCVRTVLNKPYEARILLPSATVKELVKAYSKGLEKIFTDFQKDAELAVR